MLTEETNAGKNSRLQLNLDYRIIIVVLLLVIVVMLAVWKPWSGAPASSDRVINVSGEARITAEPDEYVFNPYYQFKNADKQTALNEATKKSDEVIKKLKELGVDDNKIKSDTNGYGDYYYYDSINRTNTYNLRLTVTVNARDQAQKIQDYLVSTTPTGSVSPQASFSDKKRKELESKARDEATKEARAKADQSAKNLGFRVGSVKSVDDGNGFGGFTPYGPDTVTSGEAEDAKTAQLQVQPGENILSYSVTVVYYLK